MKKQNFPAAVHANLLGCAISRQIHANFHQITALLTMTAPEIFTAAIIRASLNAFQMTTAPGTSCAKTVCANPNALRMTTAPGISYA